MRRNAAVLTAAIAGLLTTMQTVDGVGVMPQSAGAPALQISHRARAVAPGEVVLVDIRSSEPIRDVRAQWLGQNIGSYEIAPGRWQALAPIDVAAKPGKRVLAVQANTAGGRAMSRDYVMVVAPRTFPARRLTVDPRFVDPPAAELTRIDAERKAIEAIFADPSPERYWTMAFVVPVPGAATSSFGRQSFFNGEARGQHTGADFQAANGTPVVAPNRGRVVLVADHYFPGRIVIIDHGLGVYSYLAHLSSFVVREGAIVERGQRVALSGASGRVTGPHLHWTLRMGKARVDPLSLVAISGEESVAK
jgi:murein DD-endopeptidase MepM/ murein hydrolase activator NlpD